MIMGGCRYVEPISQRILKWSSSQQCPRAREREVVPSAGKRLGDNPEIPTLLSGVVVAIGTFHIRVPFQSLHEAPVEEEHVHLECQIDEEADDECGE